MSRPLVDREPLMMPETPAPPRELERQSPVSVERDASPEHRAEPPVLEPSPDEPTPPDEEADAGPAAPEEVEVLAFRLGKEAYGVPVERVREVLRMRDITPVPHTPEFVLGVTSLRGKVLPVVDIGKRLGVSPGTRDDRSRIVVVSMENEETGMLVDRMTGVVRIPAEAFRPAPETIESGEGAEFLSGIARKDEVLYILLDIDKAVGL